MTVSENGNIPTLSNSTLQSVSDIEQNGNEISTELLLMSETTPTDTTGNLWIQSLPESEDNSIEQWTTELLPISETTPTDITDNSWIQPLSESERNSNEQWTTTTQSTTTESTTTSEMTPISSPGN